MKLVTDAKGQLASQALLEPNTPYEVQKTAEGQIILTKLTHAEVPTVHPTRVNGRLRGARIQVSRKTVAEAVRADRDSR
jgi:hypothetical protein